MTYSIREFHNTPPTLCLSAYIPPRNANPLKPPTYGAGFGNKRASQPTLSPSSSNEKSVDDEDLHFDTQSRHGSAPYSNAHTYGSASTAGAGWGNKTGSFGDDAEGQKGMYVDVHYLLASSDSGVVCAVKGEKG